MAQTQVQTPEGNMITVEHPEGASDEDILSYAQQNHQPAQMIAGMQPPAAISDIPQEVKNAYGETWQGAKNAATTAVNALNPFSEERHAAYAKQANAPSFMQGLGQEIGQLAQTGKGLAAVPEAALAGATTFTPIPAVVGAGRSVIGHGMADLEHVIGQSINPDVAAKDNPQEMYQTGKKNFDTSLLGLSPSNANPSGINTLPNVGRVPTKDQIFQAGSDAFDQARKMGAQLSPTVLSDFANMARTDLSADGYTARIAPKAHGILEDESANAGQTPLGVDDLLGFRKQLRLAQGSNDPQERAAATIVKHTFDKYIGNLQPSQVIQGDAGQLANLLDTGRQNWAAAERMEGIDSKAAAADLRASAANSGMNTSNKIRQNLASLVLSPKQSAGWSPEALQQATNVIQGTGVGNTARRIKNIAGGGGGLGTLAAGGIGGFFGGAPGAVAAAGIGIGAHLIENASTARQLALLRSLLSSESPLAQSMARPATVSPQIQALSSMLLANQANPNINGSGYGAR